MKRAIPNTGKIVATPGALEAFSRMEAWQVCFGHVRTCVESHESLVAALEAAWSFIENVTEEDPRRTDKFFATREIVREAFAKASRS